MLKITLHDSAKTFRLELEGKLAGPWVREVELCWQTAESSIQDKDLIIDMREVTFVDASGEALLKDLHKAGAQFVAKTPLIRELIFDITGKREQTEENSANVSPLIHRLLPFLLLLAVVIMVHDAFMLA